MEETSAMVESKLRPKVKMEDIMDYGKGGEKLAAKDTNITKSVKRFSALILGVGPSSECLKSKATP